MKAMKAAIVGAGLQGNRRASVLRLSGGEHLALVADIDPQAAQRLAQEYGCAATNRWQDAIESDEVSAVLVCTPPDLHAAIAVPALRREARPVREAPGAQPDGGAGGLRRRAGVGRQAEVRPEPPPSPGGAAGQAVV